MKCPHCLTDIVLALGATYGTATADQRDRITALLRAAGPAGVTTDEFRLAGIYQLSARLFELRAMGWVITTKRYSGVGSDSYFHKGMGRYVLVSEPERSIIEGATECSS